MCSFPNAFLNNCNHLEHFTITGDMVKIQNILDFLKLIFPGPSSNYVQYLIFLIRPRIHTVHVIY